MDTRGVLLTYIIEIPGTFDTKKALARLGVKVNLGNEN
jgi:hypothetical protein